MAETSTKPYLIRAIHDWCTDNGYTPYLAVSVNERTQVPREYVRNGEIVLNAGVMATNRLNLGNDFIEFEARFNGVVRAVMVPVDQVTAIYARETGHGMAFDVAKPLAEPETSRIELADHAAGDSDEQTHRHTSARLSPVPTAGSAPGPQPAPAPTPRGATPDGEDPPPSSPNSPKGRPTLTRIK